MSDLYRKHGIAAPAFVPTAAEIARIMKSQETNRWEAAKSLIKDNPRLVNELVLIAGVKMSLLYLAADGGDASTVELLITNGADLGRADSESALAHAILRDRKDIVEVLIERGMDPKKGMIRETKWGTPLALAVRNGGRDRAEIVAFLIAHGADVNETLDSGKTLLETARALRKSKTVELLLEHGAHE